MPKALSYFLFCVLVLFGSCKDNSEKSKIEPEAKQKFRTVLVYLAANNSLEEEAYKNMQQMEQSIGDIDGHLIVYAKLPNQRPALYEVSKKTGNKGGLIKIKDYPPYSSSDPLVMKSVIKETQELYPAESYGLILWSHATGWIPASQGGIKLKSFGDDGGHVMDITDLNNALSNNFDFIMFDACSMASVEVLYEIKDKSKYFIASPGEVISNGMPYHKITNELFSPEPQDYKIIAEKYYNHYNSLSGLNRSATISIIEAGQLHKLAAQTKTTLHSQSPLHTDFNRNYIQRMDFDRIGNPLIAFDFLDFINQNYNNSNNYQNTKSALEKTIHYKANTPLFNGFEIHKNSGLTCYIPHKDNSRDTHTFYKSLKWYKDSGFDALFDLQ
ncbi:clostripain-related cysteine peptidase [Sphingobacterium tabacisoli]|uniref:Clostripain-related cysteine peptidase n=1 Tax=Sphingobacterium tabacisoli TaxID=2044855 RepID=A0ABW5L3Z6_9SPHI|nr:clostripain-related cysteine peptidase [Sphingobacterium tabacisoli]